MWNSAFFRIFDWKILETFTKFPEWGGRSSMYVEFSWCSFRDAYHFSLLDTRHILQISRQRCRNECNWKMPAVGQGAAPIVSHFPPFPPAPPILPFQAGITIRPNSRHLCGELQAWTRAVYVFGTPPPPPHGLVHVFLLVRRNHGHPFLQALLRSHVKGARVILRRSRIVSLWQWNFHFKTHGLSCTGEVHCEYTF